MASTRADAATVDTDDPLLQLFYGEPLSAEAFHKALRKQRAIPPMLASGEAASNHA